MDANDARTGDAEMTWMDPTDCLQEENGVSREVPARLWTSSLQRTISTAALIKHPVLESGWLQMANRVYRCGEAPTPSQPGVR
jgi:hypothetical protein